MKQKMCLGGMLFILLFSFGPSGFGQANLLRRFPSAGKSDLKISGSQPLAVQTTNPSNQIQSLWDIRFQYNVTDLSGLASPAGVVYIKGKFIVSVWNVLGQVMIFDSVGTFLENRVIAGVGATGSGIRGMTTDGNFIYAVINTTSIAVINPNTMVRTRTITVPAAVGAIRFITYNPAGNNGSGSFWVGNFTTALFEINKPGGTTATLLSTIPATTHGLSAMYGAAYESDGANSKFWIFNQADPNGSGSTAVIVQLDASGVQTGVVRDVNPDFGLAPTVGLAGGIGIGVIPGFLGNTLYGINQGTDGGLIGYDIAQLQFDASVDSFNISNRMVAWPKELDLAPSFGGRVRSLGQANMTSVAAGVNITDGFTGTVVENLPVTPFPMASGEIKRFQTAPITSSLFDVSVYFADGLANYVGDQNSSNDTVSAVFEVTDSTMAKDYAFVFPDLAGRVGIGAGAAEEKAIGVRYNAPTATYVSSVTYLLSGPFEGESSSASLFTIDNGVISTTPIATTGTYTATADDETDGVLVTLAFATPVLIPPGDFLVAVNELGDSTLGIGFTSQIYTPNNFYVKWLSSSAGAWTDLGSFGANFQKAASIYPNFGLGFQKPASIALSVTDTSLCAGNTFKVPYNPGGATTYLPGNMFSVEISDAAGLFTSPMVIGTKASLVADTIVATIPTDLAAGTGYKLRITSTKPLRAGIEILAAPKVKALPLSLGTIAGGNSFCPNDSNKVYQVPPGSGVSSYNWTLPAGATFMSNPDSNSIKVHFGTTAGQIQVSASNACGAGPVSNKAVNLTVVLQAVVTTFTPSTTVCQGANVPFITTPTNGGTAPTYIWLKNNNPIPGATNSSYSATDLVNGDKISVILTSSIFCGTPNIDTSNQVTMIVNAPLTPTASITSNAIGNSACQGVQITFSSTVDNAGGTGPQYQWFRNATSIVGGTQTTLNISTLTSTDSVRLRYSVSGTCLTTPQVFSNWIKTTINPVGPVSYTVAANTLTAVATDVTSYQWFLDGNQIPGATSMDYTIMQSGLYCVEVQFTSGCKNKSTCTQQTFVGVNELVQDNGFTVFPNPAKNELNVKWSLNSVSEIEIWNTLGQKVVQSTVGQTKGKAIQVGDLAPGLYRVVCLTSDGKKVMKSFVKE